MTYVTFLVFVSGTRLVFDDSGYIDTEDCPEGHVRNQSYTLSDSDAYKCPMSSGGILLM